MSARPLSSIETDALGFRAPGKAPLPAADDLVMVILDGATEPFGPLPACGVPWKSVSAWRPVSDADQLDGRLRDLARQLGRFGERRDGDATLERRHAIAFQLIAELQSQLECLAVPLPRGGDADGPAHEPGPPATSGSKHTADAKEPNQ